MLRWSFAHCTRLRMHLVTAVHSLCLQRCGLLQPAALNALPQQVACQAMLLLTPKIIRCVHRCILFQA
jgi:hypothetical protein